MPTTRYTEVYDNQGNLTATEPYEVSDAELAQELYEQHFNDAHTAALNALRNWDQLTLQQKDVILYNLLAFVLWQHDLLPPTHPPP